MSSPHRKSNTNDCHGGDENTRRRSTNRSVPGAYKWYPDKFQPNITIQTPPLDFASNTRPRGFSFKEYVATAAAYSLVKSAWDTWQSSRYESMRRQAEEEREARVNAERREAEERRLRELGIEPHHEVSPNDIADARRDIGYVEGSRNIVITGNLSAGKSSLINAIRDVNFGNDGYAPTGTAETTTRVRCYADARHDGILWYDTPGAGTVNVSAWGYYYTHKLFAYDIVILAHESSLTQADHRILQVCELFNQPCYIVRTKRDQHIRNWAQDMGCPLDEAREAFLEEVQSDVNQLRPGTPSNLSANSAPVFDHVISAEGIRSALNGEPSPNDDPVRAYVDEERFLKALGLLED